MLFNPIVMEEFKKKKKPKSKAVSAWEMKKGKHKQPSLYVEAKVEKRKS